MAIAATPVRCSGCKRTVAWAVGKDALRQAVYCNSWCATEPIVTPLEERNDLWDALLRYGQHSPMDIARLYGVAHSLVYKTSNKRKADYTPA